MNKAACAYRLITGGIIRKKEREKERDKTGKGGRGIMKNIWAIFKGDVNRIRKNVIAMIVIVGITVVPSLYAWFNIAAS